MDWTIGTAKTRGPVHFTDRKCIDQRSTKLSFRNFCLIRPISAAREVNAHARSVCTVRRNWYPSVQFFEYSEIYRNGTKVSPRIANSFFRRNIEHINRVLTRCISVRVYSKRGVARSTSKLNAIFFSRHSIYPERRSNVHSRCVVARGPRSGESYKLVFKLV